MFPDLINCRVAILGLGYVGLPLALGISKSKICYRTNSPLKRKVIGFDINLQRIEELKKGIDRTRETNSSDLLDSDNLIFTSSTDDLQNVDVFIVTVPTPIDNVKRPDLSLLISASKTIGEAINKRSQKFASRDLYKAPIIIYESTVYPGVTDEECIPVISKYSNLKLNKKDGFFCGYSPERINPGDINHRLINIKKVTSGSTKEVAKWIDQFYGSFIKAGTHLASSIKVAEAAKVIENTQRDLNIALVNELAMIFKLMDLDTLDVIDAASSKWNFIPFKPGLVGGHCIGVDPYYLTHKAEELGYNPEIVLAGRRINDNMSDWLAQDFILKLVKNNLIGKGKKVLIMGITFKENCPDIRNSLSIKFIKKIKDYEIDCLVVDPWVDEIETQKYLNINISNKVPEQKFAGIMLLVAHEEFRSISKAKWKDLILTNGIIYDIKGIVPKSLNPIRI